MNVFLLVAISVAVFALLVIAANFIEYHYKEGEDDNND